MICLQKNLLGINKNNEMRSIEALKIFWINDSNINNFDNILFYIPEVNINYENILRDYFKPLLIQKEYLENNKTWFWNSQTIINFFENTKTEEDLKNNLEYFVKPIDLIPNKKDILTILKINESILKLNDFSYKKLSDDYLDTLSENIINSPEILNIYDFLKTLYFESSIENYINLDIEVIDLLSDIENLKNPTNKDILNLLYNKPDNIIEQALEFLPEEYSNHYYLIKNRIVNVWDEKDLFLKYLLDNIEINKEYEEIKLKDILTEAYKLIGKKLEKEKRNIKDILSDFFYIVESSNNKIKLL